MNSWSGPGYRGGLPESHDPGRKRIVGMSIAVSVALLVIVCQLWYLQVLEGGRFQEASDKNRIRIRPIAAPRGILFDRNGLPLVDNRPAAQREQHHHDERDVGRDVRDAERGADGGVSHPAAEHGDREEGAHQPSLLNDAATSRMMPPVSRSTSSIRAKSTAGVTCA